MFKPNLSSPTVWHDNNSEVLLGEITHRPDAPDMIYYSFLRVFSSKIVFDEEPAKPTEEAAAKMSDAEVR